MYKKPIFKSIALVFATSLTLGANAVSAKDICAGTAYSGNTEAQGACPAVCEGTKATFNGQWTNQASNVEAAGCQAGVSVCGSNIGDICADVAYNGNDEAQAACPAVVEAVRTFNGNWTNQRSNVELAGCKPVTQSVCGCG